MPELTIELLTDMLRDALRQGKEPSLAVTSNSMAPFLKTGDTLLLAYVELEDIKPGDIIAITTSSGLLVHRYWGQSDEAGRINLITKGDRVHGFDPASLPKQLLGRVISRSRDLSAIDLRVFPGKWLQILLVPFLSLRNRWFQQQSKSSDHQLAMDDPDSNISFW